MSGASKPLQTLNKARWTLVQNFVITSPEIRKAFVQRVLGVTKINDSVLDWLHAAIFGTGKIASPSFNNGGSFSSFSSDEDDSDTGDDETLENKTIGDESPYPYGEYCPTPSICGSEDSRPADSEKENEGSLQPAASFDIWDSRSTTPSHKTLDTTAASTAENAGRDLEAAHLLSRLMQIEAPAAAEPPSEIASDLSDESMPSELLTSVAKRRLSHSDSSDDDEESGRTFKRRRGGDAQVPRKRVQCLGRLVFTINAVHIERTGGDIEALEFDPEHRVWIDSEGVEYVSECDKFTALRVYWGMLRQLPYWLRFKTERH
ncbi:hypothetical protein GGR57DRAFT_451596 [Xylariaceae sp. FL1272]|nr:hypothetical protein GGR57DRAFT_451596 [Xylariaceae sp. FL1272]